MRRIGAGFLLIASMFFLSQKGHDPGYERLYDPYGRDGGDRGYDIRSTEEGLHEPGERIVPGLQNLLSPLERGVNTRYKKRIHEDDVEFKRVYITEAEANGEVPCIGP